jgi:hypothetical protein
MMRSRLMAVAAPCACFVGAPVPVLTEQQSTQGPPVPFEDVGACPFEGCVYREWTAKAAVRVRTERRLDAPVSYELRTGEKVTALTGIVVTLKAGLVQFREPRNLTSSCGETRIEPGQTLYLLTYQGEGFTKAWFNGRLCEDMDTVSFITASCDLRPSRCAGKIIEPSKTEWWVQVRNRVGIVGWTHEPEKFDGKNAIGGDAASALFFRSEAIPGR